MFEDAEVQEKLMELGNQLLESRVSLCVHHVVGYAGQIGAKLSDFRGQCWLHVSVELFDNIQCLAVDYDQWKLHAVVEC